MAVWCFEQPLHFPFPVLFPFTSLAPCIFRRVNPRDSAAENNEHRSGRPRLSSLLVTEEQRNAQRRRQSKAKMRRVSMSIKVRVFGLGVGGGCGCGDRDVNER